MIYFVISIHVVVADVKIVEHELDIAEKSDVTGAPVIGIALDRIPHSIQNTLLSLQVPRHRIAVILDDRVDCRILRCLGDRVHSDVLGHKVDDFLIGNILDIVLQPCQQFSDP